MKWYWMGDRDHVDHSLCGGCDDDADCTYGESKLTLLSLVLLVVSIGGFAWSVWP